MKKIYGRLPLIFCFLIAIAFSIKNLREPDLWWQIRTGEWILEHKQIPKQDVFSYTYNGSPWINIKWGFEVLAASITKAAGPECVFIVQAIVTCLILFFLIKIMEVQFPAAKAGSKNSLPGSHLPVIASLLLTLVAMEYRVNGRPEMFSHLFTVVFLFFLLRHRKSPSNKLFWLVPLQIIWANFHEAFGIGIVLIAIFCAGGWLEYFLSRKKILASSVELPKLLSLALLSSVAALLVNPNGVQLLIRPFNIMGQVYENKFTTELVGFSSAEYWQWNVYWAVGLLLIGISGSALFYYTVKTKSNRFKLFIAQTGIGYLLTLAAFLFLATTAFRNIIFFVLVFFPLLALGLRTFFNKTTVLQKFERQVVVVICLLQVGMYAFIVSGKYYELTNSHDRFGLEARATINPLGAGEFIQQHHLRGKCFSDYLTSSYLLWKLQPEFKTFIDLRDLDVFPTAFFTTFAEAVTYPESFERLDSIHHFSYVVLYRPQFAALHDYLYHQSRFKLAFVDAVAAVYVPKNSGADSSTIISFAQTGSVAHGLPMAVNYLLNPLFKQTDAMQVDYDLLAAGFYINLGELEAAQTFGTKSAGNNIDNYKGLEMLGEVYYNKALLPGSSAAVKDGYMERAKKMYESAISANSNFAASYYGLGAVYFQQRNMAAALENFEKSIALDKSNLNAYLFAAGCCNYFINQNNVESNTYTQRALNFYLEADKLNPDNPEITLNLGFLYFRLNDCSKTSRYLKKVVDYTGLSEQQRQQARVCISKCGS